MAASAELSLADLLAEVAAHTPAPGGGSASAWAGALAAALAQMGGSFTGEVKAAERAGALRSELLESGERELHSYEPVLEASRLPADDPSRQERYAAALSEASEAPLAIARASAEVAELAATIVQKSNPALAGDAIVGVLLAEASTCAAARLVEINLGGDESDRRLPEVQELSRRAGAAREAALGRRWPV